MISFKNFITEARMAPLYHGTRIYNAFRILEDNVLRAGYTHGGETPPVKGQQPNVISLTRNLGTALHWGNGIVFELNQQKLTHRYKIQPIEIEYVWHAKGKFGNDPTKKYEPKQSKLYEEYVVGNIKPLDEYLTKIIVNKEFLRTIKEYYKPNDYKTLINHPLLYNFEEKRWMNK